MAEADGPFPDFPTVDRRAPSVETNTVETKKTLMLARRSRIICKPNVKYFIIHLTLRPFCQDLFLAPSS